MAGWFAVAVVTDGEGGVDHRLKGWRDLLGGGDGLDLVECRDAHPSAVPPQDAYRTRFAEKRRKLINVNR